MPCVAFFDAIHPLNIVVLFLVVLIVVGPKRLPEVARKLGRMMETFRRAADEFKTQLMSMDQEPPTSHPPPTDTDADGVPQPPSEADIYSNQTSPYPGNEEHYDDSDGGRTSSSAVAQTAHEDVRPPSDSSLEGERPREPSPESDPPPEATP